MEDVQRIQYWFHRILFFYEAGVFGDWLAYWFRKWCRYFLLLVLQVSLHGNRYRELGLGLVICVEYVFCLYTRLAVCIASFIILCSVDEENELVGTWRFRSQCHRQKTLSTHMARLAMCVDKRRTLHILLSLTLFLTLIHDTDYHGGTRVTLIGESSDTIYEISTRVNHWKHLLRKKNKILWNQYWILRTSSMSCYKN
jgi:hypothetical protein